MNVAKVHQSLRYLPAIIIVLMIVMVSTTMAQKFEESFGGSCWEWGSGGVPLAQGGYASVGVTYGTANGSCSGEDVYIVCLTSNGTLAWSNAYDLGGYDIGADIRQCANGDLIVLGSSGSSSGIGNGDLFIMRLSSTTGAVIWASFYGTKQFTEMGFRIIETQLSAGGGSSKGDFVAVGELFGPGSAWDGLMLRVTSSGSVVWMNTYDGGALDALTAVVESRVGPNASDIIAIGTSASFNQCSKQALLMRVNGGTGLIGASPQGVAAYEYGEAFWLSSVDELTVGNNAGRIVCAGFIRVASNQDIYVLETSVDPCQPIVDATYGDADTAQEEATVIREIVSGSSGGLNNGNLMIAGSSAVSPSRGGFLMELDPTLAIVAPPLGVGFRLYGATMESFAWGEPVLALPGVTTAGFYLTGLSWISSPLDLQLHTTKTDNLGVTGCNDTIYTPIHLRPRLLSNCVSMTVQSVGQRIAAKVADTARKYDSVFCNDSLAFRGSGSSNGPGLSGTIHDPMNMTAITNSDFSSSPVVLGNLVMLGYRLEQKGSLQVLITDEYGHRVYSRTGFANAGPAQIIVQTAGWLPGNYVISSVVGDRNIVDRIVIPD